MKKMISVFLLLVMALSLASCGKSDTNADTNGGASTTVAEAQQGSSTSEQNESKPVSLGDFSVQDFDGNAVSKDIFADYDLTMVNLWTTTCSYCIEEMPILNELRKEFQDDGVRFNIISVCMDVGNTNEINEDSLKKAKEIIKTTGVEYPTCIAAQERGARFPALCGVLSVLKAVLLHPAQSGAGNPGTALQLCKIDLLQRELVSLLGHHLLNGLCHNRGHGCEIGLFHLISFHRGLATPPV